MVHFDIDLSFTSTDAPGPHAPSADASVTVPGSGSGSSSSSGSGSGSGSGEASVTEPATGFHGRVTASGSTVHVFVSDPSRLPRGSRHALRDLRTVAAALAARGVEVCVDSTAGTIVRIGAVKPNPLQRLVSWSPHIAVGTPVALAPLLGRRGPHTPLPVPPATLFPLVPTVARGIRRRPTTTHYLPGSGRPRLVFTVGSENWDGRPPREFDLLPGVTTIGSGPDADLRLPGLESVHAEIRHDADDEYVLHALAPIGGGSGWPGEVDAPDGPDRRGRILRTGARLDLATWRLAFFREEFADHGRPFGGRLGGELSHQKPQPPRPTPGVTP